MADKWIREDGGAWLREDGSNWLLEVSAGGGISIPVAAYHRNQFNRQEMTILKQSTAVDVLIGPFVDSTDGNTEETALTIAAASVLLSKNGQTLTLKSDVTTCAHDANGMYNCELDATDTNTVGNLVLFVHVAGALAVRHEFQVVEEAVYNDLFGASAAGYAGVTELATVDSNVDAILLDTAEIGTAGAGLTAIEDIVWDAILTGGSHNTSTSAGRRLRTLQTGGNYEGGMVWIDTVSGTSGTTLDENGVVGLPVLTYAEALTIASSGGYESFHIANGSTITLTAATNNKVFEGHEWTLALGGQSVASTMVIDAAVSGTGTGTDSEYQDCIFAVTSLPSMQAYNCSFFATTSGGFTMSGAGDYRFINCQSGVAGSGSPLFTVGTGPITAEFRRWSGGIAFAGIAAGDTLTISGELGTVDLGSPTGGTVEIRGTYKAITNTGSATVNTTGAILGGDVASILVDTGTTLPATLATIAGYIDTEIAAILVDTGTTIPALIAALNDISAAQVNAEVSDVLNTDTLAELSAVPAANAAISAKINWIFAQARNKLTQTATTQAVRNDADSGNIATSTVSDDGTTFTRGEFS